MKNRAVDEKHILKMVLRVWKSFAQLVAAVRQDHVCMSCMPLRIAIADLKQRFAVTDRFVPKYPVDHYPSDDVSAGNLLVVSTDVDSDRHDVVFKLGPRSLRLKTAIENEHGSLLLIFGPSARRLGLVTRMAVRCPWPVGA